MIVGHESDVARLEDGGPFRDRAFVPVYRRLSALAARGSDLESVTELLAERLGATVWIVGERMNIIAASTSTVSGNEALELVRARPPLPGWDRVLETAAATRLPVRSSPDADGRPVSVAPVLVDDAVAATCPQHGHGNRV